MADNWTGANGDWNVSSNWSAGIPGSATAITASAGVVTVSSNEAETAGDLQFSNNVTLLLTGTSVTLDVDAGRQGGAADNFVLGSGGAILNGTSDQLTVDSYLNGTASGTVYIEGSNNTFYWNPLLANYPAPATTANSSNLTVAFLDSGSGGTFQVSGQFAGQVTGFQAGDNIAWSFQDGSSSFSIQSVANNVVTLKDTKNNTISIKLAGAANQYTSSNLFINTQGLLNTSYVAPAPKVGSATYNASTGQLVVTASTAAGTTPFSGTPDPTKLSLTGEDGGSYNLTGGTVSATSGTSFTVTLTSADQLQVDGLLDQNGTQSTGNDLFNNGHGPTTYVINAATGFDTNGAASNGGVTVSNALTPTISSVSYNPNTGVLTLNGSGFEDVGGYGGINLGQITLKGSNGSSFTFNAQDYGNAISKTQAVINLSDTGTTNAQSVMSGEESSVNALFDKAGTVSKEGTTYNLSATSGWDGGAGAAISTQGVFVTCFVSGTRIRTQRGDVAVEDLMVGDVTITRDGRRKAICWIGKSLVRCDRHPNPQKAWPVRVRAGAFGEGLPYADLWLSPEHAVCFDNALVPARALIDGDRIASVPMKMVNYWHIELEGHDILLANGLPAESYLDTGNRRFFDGGIAQLHFNEKTPAGCEISGRCLPLVQSGPRLTEIRAKWFGKTSQSEVSPGISVTLVADGIEVTPCVASESELRFVVPRDTQEIRLCSTSFFGAGDVRRLGVLVSSLAVSDGSEWREIDLDHSGLVAGWHDREGDARAPWRWTNGEGHISSRIWEGLSGALLLRVKGKFADFVKAEYNSDDLAA